MTDGQPIHDREEPRFYVLDTRRGPTIYHNPGPNRLRFPVLFVSEDLGNSEEVAGKVADLLNEHWKDGR